jgi:hypothetical protein
MKGKIIFSAVAALAAGALLLPVAVGTADGGCCGTCGGSAVTKAVPTAGAPAAKAACGAGCTKPCCAAGPKGAAGKKACGATCTKACCAGKPAAVHAHLATALKHLDKAHKAIEAGDHKAALAAIAEARELVRLQHDGAARKAPLNATCPMTGRPVKPGYTRTWHGKAVGFCGPGCAGAWDRAPAEKRALMAAKAGAAGPTGVYANARCPIMGSPIKPGKAYPANLVRDYQGKKVAFCCGGCPVAWDKLSEAQKDAKLQKAAGDEKTG